MSVGFLVHGFGTDASGVTTVATTYDAGAAAHFARMTSSDATLLGHLDGLIVGLKADGIWSKIVGLYVVKTLESDSLLNLKSSSYDLVKNGSVTFAADLGFSIDQDISTEFLEMPYNPVDDGGLVGNDDVAYYQWTNGGTFDTPCTIARAGFCDWMLSGIQDISGHYLQTYFQAFSTAKIISNPSPSHDFTAYSRRSSSNIDLAVGSTTSPFSATRSESFYDRSTATGLGVSGHFEWGIGTSLPGGFGGIRFCAMGIGRGLTPTELGYMEARLNTYLTARGAI